MPGCKGPGGGAGFHRRFPDFADIFGDLFGFGGFGRSTAGRATRPRRGADLQYRLDLTFEEAVFGVEKEIEITRDELCSTCNGTRRRAGHLAGALRHLQRRRRSAPGAPDDPGLDGAGGHLPDLQRGW